MGGYQAAVISAGFAGVSLEATPTAICEYDRGDHFIMLSLVSAFFIEDRQRRGDRIHDS